MSPWVLTYLEVEIILSELGFHIYISHSVIQICLFTVITNEVILKNLSEIDFGGLMWGPLNSVTLLRENCSWVCTTSLQDKRLKHSPCARLRLPVQTGGLSRGAQFRVSPPGLLFYRECCFGF